MFRKTAGIIILLLGLYLAAVVRIYIYHGEIILNIFKYKHIANYLIIVPLALVAAFVFEKYMKSRK